MRYILRLIDLVTDFFARLAAVMLGLIVIFSWVEVVSRYFFEAPTNLASSLAKHIVMAAVMSMLPWLSREGYHVAMSFIYEKAPERFSRPIGIVIAALSSAICFLSAWIAYGETVRQYEGGVQNMDVIEFPLWWVTSFMVYGFLFAGIHFAKQALTGRVVQRSEV